MTREAMGGGKAKAREKSDFSFNWKGHFAAERGRWADGRAYGNRNKKRTG